MADFNLLKRKDKPKPACYNKDDARIRENCKKVIRKTK